MNRTGLIRIGLPWATALGLTLGLGALVPSAAYAQNEVFQLRGLFEQALTATNQGRYDDADYLLRQVEDQADRIRDWSLFYFSESAERGRSTYVRYLVRLQRAVLALHRNDEYAAEDAGRVVQMARDLGKILGDETDEAIAELQTGLATSIAIWGGWAPYEGSYRSSDFSSGGGGSYRTPDMVEAERVRLIEHIPGFGPYIEYFDAPPPRSLKETKHFFGDGRRANLEVEFEALTGPAREYVIQVEAYNGSLYVEPWVVGRAYSDHDNDGRDDGESWEQVVPPTSGHVVWTIDWAGHGQRWSHTRWRVSSGGPTGRGAPGPWRAVEWN